MRVETFPNFFQAGAKAAASPTARLASMLNEQAEGQSPLERAKQALLDAKAKLDQQRDERIETALAGYKAMCSRQRSYESGLSIQQEQLEDFQTLSSRYDALSDELSAAKDEACAAAGTTLDPTQQNKLSLRVSSLERELAATDHDISALVEKANRYADSQRQYAAYLEKTGQGGYAAFEYQDQTKYTRENFLSETSGMIGRMETGVSQWRQRVSNYCGQYGLTPYDFESYLQERQKLGSACFAAQQRLSELLYAADCTASSDSARQAKPTETAAPGRNRFDTVELSARARSMNPPPAAVDKAKSDDE